MNSPYLSKLQVGLALLNRPNVENTERIDQTVNTNSAFLSQLQIGLALLNRPVAKRTTEKVEKYTDPSKKPVTESQSTEKAEPAQVPPESQNTLAEVQENDENVTEVRPSTSSFQRDDILAEVQESMEKTVESATKENPSQNEDFASSAQHEDMSSGTETIRKRKSSHAGNNTLQQEHSSIKQPKLLLEETNEGVVLKTEAGDESTVSNSNSETPETGTFLSDKPHLKTEPVPIVPENSKTSIKPPPEEANNSCFKIPEITPRVKSKIKTRTVAAIIPGTSKGINRASKEVSPVDKAVSKSSLKIPEIPSSLLAEKQIKIEPAPTVPGTSRKISKIKPAHKKAKSVKSTVSINSKIPETISPLIDIKPKIKIEPAPEVSSETLRNISDDIKPAHEKTNLIKSTVSNSGFKIAKPTSCKADKSQTFIIKTEPASATVSGISRDILNIKQESKERVDKDQKYDVVYSSNCERCENATGRIYFYDAVYILCVECKKLVIDERRQVQECASGLNDKKLAAGCRVVVEKLDDKGNVPKLAKIQKKTPVKLKLKWPIPSSDFIKYLKRDKTLINCQVNLGNRLKIIDLDNEYSHFDIKQEIESELDEDSITEPGRSFDMASENESPELKLIPYHSQNEIKSNSLEKSNKGTQTQPTSWPSCNASAITKRADQFGVLCAAYPSVVGNMNGCKPKKWEVMNFPDHFNMTRYFSQRFKNTKRYGRAILNMHLKRKRRTHVFPKSKRMKKYELTKLYERPALNQIPVMEKEQRKQRLDSLLYNIKIEPPEEVQVQVPYSVVANAHERKYQQIELTHPKGSVKIETCLKVDITSPSVENSIINADANYIEPKPAPPDEVQQSMKVETSQLLENTTPDFIRIIKHDADIISQRLVETFETLLEVEIQETVKVAIKEELLCQNEVEGITVESVTQAEIRRAETVAPTDSWKVENKTQTDTYKRVVTEVQSETCKVLESETQTEICTTLESKTMQLIENQVEFQESHDLKEEEMNVKDRERNVMLRKRSDSYYARKLELEVKAKHENNDVEFEITADLINLDVSTDEGDSEDNESENGTDASDGDSIEVLEQNRFENSPQINNRSIPNNEENLNFNLDEASSTIIDTNLEVTNPIEIWNVTEKTTQQCQVQDVSSSSESEEMVTETCNAVLVSNAPQYRFQYEPFDFNAIPTNIVNSANETNKEANQTDFSSKDVYLTPLNTPEHDVSTEQSMDDNDDAQNNAEKSPLIEMLESICLRIPNPAEVEGFQPKPCSSPNIHSDELFQDLLDDHHEKIEIVETSQSTGTNALAVGMSAINHKQWKDAQHNATDTYSCLQSQAVPNKISGYQTPSSNMGSLLELFSDDGRLVSVTEETLLDPQKLNMIAQIAQGSSEKSTCIDTDIKGEGKENPYKNVKKLRHVFPKSEIMKRALLEGKWQPRVQVFFQDDGTVMYPTTPVMEVRNEIDIPYVIMLVDAPPDTNDMACTKFLRLLRTDGKHDYIFSMKHSPSVERLLVTFPFPVVHGARKDLITGERTFEVSRSVVFDKSCWTVPPSLYNIAEVHKVQ